LVEELEERFKREGRELDIEQARPGRGVETETQDHASLSSKGGNGNAGQATPGAATEQNSAERTGNATESAGNERPEFEIETHTKKRPHKTRYSERSRRRQGKAQAEAKNAADAELGGFALTGSIAANPRAEPCHIKQKASQSGHVLDSNCQAGTDAKL
jgi:hypothetical protein